MRTLDIFFIEFYIKNYLHQKTEEYFDVNKSVVSNWRKNGCPKRRIQEFIYRERTDNIYELFEKIYPKI